MEEQLEQTLQECAWAANSIESTGAAAAGWQQREKERQQPHFGAGVAGDHSDTSNDSSRASSVESSMGVNSIGGIRPTPDSECNAEAEPYLRRARQQTEEGKHFCEKVAAEANATARRGAQSPSQL